MSTVPHALPFTIRFSLALSWAFRTVLDRALPAAIFGFVAISRGSLLLTRLGQAPAPDDAQAWLTYRLDIAHQTLAFAFLSLITMLCLTRKAPRTQRAGLVPLLAALAGTFLMAFPAMQPRTIESREILLAASVVLIAGLTFTVYAVGSLGKCFGLAPEARGLVTGGPYALVRHPVYLGEFVAAVGVLIPVLSPVTIIAFAMFTVAQLYRVRLEERVLEAAFDEYASYRQRVPMLFPWPRPER